MHAILTGEMDAIRSKKIGEKANATYAHMLMHETI